MAITEEILAGALAADPAERRRLHDEVVVSHLWLADTIARRFSFRGEELEDLVQVARVGLVEACERFSPERGAFLAFAAPTITGVLKRHFRDHGWSIRPPRHAQEVAAEMWSQWPAIVQRLGRIPTGRDLADHLDEPPPRSPRPAGRTRPIGRPRSTPVDSSASTSRPPRPARRSSGSKPG